ncbi:aspartate aminotransferase family protein, partial [Chloroflexota bacterium]
QLEEKAVALEEGITKAARAAGIEIRLSRVSSMLTVFFSRGSVTDYETAAAADTGLYARFFHEMLSQGVYMPPSQFEAAFVSAAHSDEDIQATIAAVDKAFKSLS